MGTLLHKFRTTGTHLVAIDKLYRSKYNLKGPHFHTFSPEDRLRLSQPSLSGLCYMPEMSNSYINLTSPWANSNLCQRLRLPIGWLECQNKLFQDIKNLARFSYRPYVHFLWLKIEPLNANFPKSTNFRNAYESVKSTETYFQIWFMKALLASEYPPLSGESRRRGQ
jgi:hypothetical protein